MSNPSPNPNPNPNLNPNPNPDQVRRQITGVTLLSLHLSSDAIDDAYELDNSPTDLRHVMVGLN